MKHLLFFIGTFAASVSTIAQSSWPECNAALAKENISDIDPKTGMPDMTRRQNAFNTCLYGKIIPDFSATTSDGKVMSPKDIKGKVALVNFWFIGCPPCVKEIPMFNELNEEYKDRGFMILAFALDSPSSIESFIKTHPMNFNVFPSSSKLIQTFGIINGYPTSVVLNKNGEAVDFSFGGAMDDAGIALTKERLRKLIEEQIAVK